MMCKCNQSFDVRCACWVKSSNWKNCPLKIGTTLWRIENEYDYYKKIEDKGFESLRFEIKKICKFNENEWLQLLEMYLEQKKEMELGDEFSEEESEDN